MQTLACLNGEITPADEAKVSIWDRGFLFGDAVYEVYRLYRGRRWLDEAHTTRLRRSLEALDFPAVEFDRLRERMDRTTAASGVQEGTLYIQITRGAAPRRHIFPDPGTPPTELIVVRPYEDAATARSRQTGVAVISQPDLRWKRCDVKSVNLLANVLACEAAHRAEAHEAVLVDEQGLVTEATHSSVLWVRNGHLGGTPEGNEILPGTTRQCVLRLARDLGIPFEPGRARLEVLAEADEAFLVGTTIEVLPIVQLDGRPIGDGVPGPVTTRLRDGFRRLVDEWLARPE
jgi:D-alanine transaminase